MLDATLIGLILAGLLLSMLYLHGALRSPRMRRLLGAMDESRSSVD